MSSENVELVRRLIENWIEGEMSMDDAWAEDAEVWPVPGFPESGPFKGRDDIRRFFDGLREGWRAGSMIVVVQAIEEAGDNVLTSLEWRATGDVSGLEIASEWTTVHTIRRGQVVRLQFFSGRQAAIEAIGLT